MGGAGEQQGEEGGGGSSGCSRGGAKRRAEIQEGCVDAGPLGLVVRAAGRKSAAEVGLKAARRSGLLAANALLDRGEVDSEDREVEAGGGVRWR